MKYGIFFILICFVHCTNQTMDFWENCPYQSNYGPAHYLKIPTEIIPHKKSYNVGDTIKIRQYYSDSIFDINFNQYFQIKNFPFRPSTMLWRFYDDLSWDSGFLVNQVVLDSIYQSEFFNPSYLPLFFTSKTIYKNNSYQFEFDLVLEEKGRYVFRTFDKYNTYNNNDELEYLNESANNIKFEGKCPNLNYEICSILIGNDYLTEFENELLYIDSQLYNGALGSLRPDNPYGFTGHIIEWMSFFGFVVE